MTERIASPFTNEHFAAFCLSMVGQPYWYGTCLYKCTESLRSRKAEQYPSHYGSSRTSRYKQDIAAQKVCADCIGGAKGYAWTDGGQGVLEAIGTSNVFSSKYGSNGCPDKGANSMFSYAKSAGAAWGTIDTLPEVVGLALHTDGHVGYYVGDGYAVEWRGFNYGCVKTKVADRTWKYWYQLPFITYDEDAVLPNTSTATTTLGNRLLKNGMSGDDVKALQELLIQLGYDLSKYGADGKFGAETEKAVIGFQTAEGLEADGLYGDLTHATLMNAIADDDADEAQKTDVPTEMPSSTPDAFVSTKVVIVSEGGKVNIRTGNSTSYGRITLVAPGTMYPYVATAMNGWHAIEVGSQIGWVSGEFSKVI